MKNLIKNPLLSFILGSIIFGGLGSVVAYNLKANQITYTPKDTTWNVNNVEDAINDLKSNWEPLFGSAIYNSSAGDMITTRTTSLDLAKGKYLVIINYAQAWPGELAEVAKESDLSLTCKNNNCEYKRLTGYYNGGHATGKSGTIYISMYTIYNLFYVNVKENDTISFSYVEKDYSNVRQHLQISAVPIK